MLPYIVGPRDKIIDSIALNLQNNNLQLDELLIKVDSYQHFEQLKYIDFRLLPLKCLRLHVKCIKSQINKIINECLLLKIVEELNIQSVFDESNFLRHNWINYDNEILDNIPFLTIKSENNGLYLSHQLNDILKRNHDFIVEICIAMEQLSLLELYFIMVISIYINF